MTPSLIWRLFLYIFNISVQKKFGIYMGTFKIVAFVLRAGGDRGGFDTQNLPLRTDLYF